MLGKIITETEELKEWLDNSTLEMFMKEFELDSVYSQCNNGVAWLLLRIKKYPFIDKTFIKIHQGYYNSRPHAWLVYNDRFIIDITLGQFESEITSLVVIDNHEPNGYGTSYIFELENMFDWLGMH